MTACSVGLQVSRPPALLRLSTTNFDTQPRINFEAVRTLPSQLHYSFLILKFLQVNHSPVAPCGKPEWDKVLEIGDELLTSRDRKLCRAAI
jgi:hypothetical protein